MARKKSKPIKNIEALKSYQLPELKVQIATLDIRGVPKTDPRRFGVQAKYVDLYTGETKKIKGTIDEVSEKLNELSSDPNLPYMKKREESFNRAKQDQEGKKLFEEGFVQSFGDIWVRKGTTYKSRENALEALQTEQQEREQIKQEDENRKNVMLKSLGPAYTEVQIEEMKKIGSPGAKLAREERKLTEGQDTLLRLKFDVVEHDGSKYFLPKGIDSNMSAVIVHPFSSRVAADTGIEVVYARRNHDGEIKIGGMEKLNGVARKKSDFENYSDEGGISSILVEDELKKEISSSYRLDSTIDLIVNVDKNRNIRGTEQVKFRGYKTEN